MESRTNNGAVMLTTPTLFDYQTGEIIRDATEQELAASRAAAEADGGAGVIEVDIGGKTRRCYVAE